VRKYNRQIELLAAAGEVRLLRREGGREASQPFDGGAVPVHDDLAVTLILPWGFPV
jgi:hypothetical protein